MVLKVVADARHPRPGSCRSSATGQKDTRHQDPHPPATACNPAANHSLQSDHCSGHSQRHFGTDIPGSPVSQRVVQPPLDLRTLFLDSGSYRFLRK